MSAARRVTESPAATGRPTDTGRRPATGWLGGRLPLETETALFVLASTLDVFMTYLLLGHRAGGDVVFVERNPVARFFIESWGVSGMVYFKFAMVAIVCVVAQLIAARRPQTARRVLGLATVIVAGVVAYSLVLLLRHG